jgi:hypothetical protein
VQAPKAAGHYEVAGRCSWAANLVGFEGHTGSDMTDMVEYERVRVRVLADRTGCLEEAEWRRGRSLKAGRQEASTEASYRGVAVAVRSCTCRLGLGLCRVVVGAASYRLLADDIHAEPWMMGREFLKALLTAIEELQHQPKGHHLPCRSGS